VKKRVKSDSNQFGMLLSSILRLVSGNQGDVPVLAQLDLELITGLKSHLGSVGPADHQVSVKLDGGGIARSTATAAIAHFDGGAKTNALSFKQRFIESGEIEAFITVLFGADVASSPDEVGFRGVSHLLDQRQEFGAGQLEGFGGDSSGHGS
jgi:hypothetical protein